MSYSAAGYHMNSDLYGISYTDTVGRDIFNFDGTSYTPTNYTPDQAAEELQKLITAGCFNRIPKVLNGKYMFGATRPDFDLYKEGDGLVHLTPTYLSAAPDIDTDNIIPLMSYNPDADYINSMSFGMPPAHVNTSTGVACKGELFPFVTGEDGDPESFAELSYRNGGLTQRHTLYDYLVEFPYNRTTIMNIIPHIKINIATGEVTQGSAGTSFSDCEFFEDEPGFIKIPIRYGMQIYTASETDTEKNYRYSYLTFSMYSDYERSSYLYWANPSDPTDYTRVEKYGYLGGEVNRLVNKGLSQISGTMVPMCQLVMPNHPMWTYDGASNVCEIFFSLPLEMHGEVLPYVATTRLRDYCDRDQCTAVWNALTGPLTPIASGDEFIDWYNNGAIIAYHTKETITQMIDSFGLYWTNKIDVARAIDSNLSEDMNLPIIGADGASGGHYSGLDNSKLPYYDATDITDEEFNPSPWKKRREPSGIKTLLGTGNVPINEFCNVYAGNARKMDMLATWLWSDSAYNLVVEDGQLTASPMEAILSARLYPFKITGRRGVAASTSRINFGGSLVPTILSLNVEMYQISNNFDAIFDFGEMRLEKHFDNFLDTQTKYTIYLPYIGFYELPVNQLIGHRLGLKYIVDIMTGSCKAVLFRDDAIFTMYDGTIGMDIPLSSNNVSSAMEKEFNRDHQQKKSFLTLLGSVAAIGAGGLMMMTGAGTVAGAGMVAGGIMGAKKTEMDMGYTEESKKYDMSTIDSVGMANNYCGAYMPKYPYLIIDRPNVENPDNYGSRVGYIYNREMDMSSVRGFTVVSNPMLNSANVPVSVVEMAKQMLTKGVIL